MRCTYAGLVLLGLTLVGVTVIVFDSVAGRAASVIAGLIAMAAFMGLWLVLSLLLRFDPK